MPTDLLSDPAVSTRNAHGLPVHIQARLSGRDSLTLPTPHSVIVRNDAMPVERSGPKARVLDLLGTSQVVSTDTDNPREVH